MDLTISKVAVNVDRGTNNQFELTLKLNGYGESIPQFTGVTYEDGKLIIGVVCPPVRPVVASALYGQSVVSRVGIYLEGGDWHAVCPHCKPPARWSDTYSSATNAKRGLNAHMRQIHLAEWLQSQQSSVE